MRTPTAAPTLSYFNPRPPRGGRPVIRAGDAAAIPISIHALREEGDSVPGTTSAPAPDFNPRPPRGGRRTDCPARQQDNDISIHALREEGDTSCLPSPQKANISIHALREEGDALPEMSTSLGVDFNPRPPRGGRQSLKFAASQDRQFQSTPSARRATIYCKRLNPDTCISIHALREEGDAAIHRSFYRTN